VTKTINTAVRGQTFTADLATQFNALTIGIHTLTIKVSDDAGGTATRIFTFNKIAVIPPAPNVTADDDGNNIVGIDTTMEYNVDYITWYNFVDGYQDLSGNHTVQVRVRAMNGNPCGLITTLTFTTNPVPITPDPPNVTADDINNKIIGIDSTMSYMYEGVGWTPYTTDPDLSGNHDVYVQVHSIGQNPSSRSVHLVFTANEGTVTLPNIKVRINGSIKTYSTGCVRINGALRNIESIWTRINGVLKKI